MKFFFGPTQVPAFVPLLAALLCLIWSPSVLSDHGDHGVPAAKPGQMGSISERQQWLSQRDNELTRRIRREIMKDSDLPSDAQNIKIITMNGEVTLKGAVRSVKDENRLLEKARFVAGESKVHDQIEILPAE